MLYEVITEISHKDAVFNLSRAALFSASLLTGKFENLKTAVDDRLHQPFRIPLIPVITSYSIHYTKLYEIIPVAPWRRLRPDWLGE